MFQAYTNHSLMEEPYGPYRSFMSYFNDIRDSRFKPCSAGEVLTFEKKAGITFPASYVEFLLMCGRGTGNFFVGSYVRFDQLHLINSKAESLLESTRSTVKISDSMFVFHYGPGSRFLFFFLHGSSDPVVYCFNRTESISTYRKEADSLSEWVRQECSLGGV